MRTTDTIARIISMGEYIRQECVMMELCLLLLLFFFAVEYVNIAYRIPGCMYYEVL